MADIAGQAGVLNQRCGWHKLVLELVLKAYICLYHLLFSDYFFNQKYLQEILKLLRSK